MTTMERVATLEAYLREHTDWHNVGMGAAKAFAPELFDGSAWIAPWEATEAMLHVAGEGWLHRGASEDWALMRDVHLKPDAT